MTQPIIRPLCAVCGQALHYRRQEEHWLQYAINPNGQLELENDWHTGEISDYLMCNNQDCDNYVFEIMPDNFFSRSADLEAFYRQIKGQTHAI